MKKPFRQVVLIDDNPDDRSSIRRFLAEDPEQLNHLTEAGTGEEGLALLAAHTPDIVLLDLNLPDCFGLEVLEALRRERREQAPVIVLTGSSNDPEMGIKALALGAQDYLVKDDITATTLSRSMTNAVTKQRLNRALEQALERTRILQGFTAALSGAATADQVARVLESCCSQIGASAIAYYLLEEDGSLGLYRQSGFRPEVMASFQKVSRDAPFPVATAAERRSSVWLHSIDEYLAGYPSVAPFLRDSRNQAWAALPTVIDGELIGVMSLAFNAPRQFDEEDREFLAGIGQLFAQAFVRARLYEQERRAKEEARQNMLFGQHLVGIVSHDLRNPLGAIMLAAKALERGPALQEPQRRLVQRIDRSAIRMTRLISDLLDLTRSRIGQTLPIELAPMDLTPLLRETSEEASQAHAGSRVVTDLPEKAALLGDPQRLAQVFSNLVSNAIKYGEPSSPVDVTLIAENGGWRVAVHNQGAPIPPERIPELFEPFRRADTEGRAREGLGLGLFIARELVRAHGGEITMRSVEGEGTTVEVWLPRSGRAPAPLPAQ